MIELFDFEIKKNPDSNFKNEMIDSKKDENLKINDHNAETSENLDTKTNAGNSIFHLKAKTLNLKSGNFPSNCNNQNYITNEALQEKSNDHKLLNSSSCRGCEKPITEQYVLKIGHDMMWHVDCLKCSQCAGPLDENSSCFFKEGKPFCKKDYYKLFAVKCFKCKVNFETNDLVMRARSLLFHIECFRCNVCNKQLVSGDEYSINGNNSILCREDFQFSLDNGFENVKNTKKGMTNAKNNEKNTENNEAKHSDIDEKSEESSSGEVEEALNHSIFQQTFNNPLQQQKISNQIINQQHYQQQQIEQQQIQPSSPSLLLYPLQSHNNNTNINNSRFKNSSIITNLNKINNKEIASHHHHHHHHHKTTRIRTVLNEKQLHTLRTCYSANSRPDALMKEQLVEMTGLSPRVIRVWFQNKRCKDKKRSIILKQIQQQNQNKTDKGFSDDSWFNQKAIHLVATSPVANDHNLDDFQPSSIDVLKCPTPYWLEQDNINNEEDIENNNYKQREKKCDFLQHTQTTEKRDIFNNKNNNNNNSNNNGFLSGRQMPNNQDDDTVVSFDDVSDSFVGE